VVSRPSQDLAAGRDYPRDWAQFQDWFPDEVRCRDYLAALRWPAGYVCPQCDAAGEPFRASGGRLVCRQCRHQGTVTAGTIFDKTRTPLRIWLAAAWHLTNQKGGVSALGLQRVLGMRSYQTAWGILHRLRHAMVRMDREPLIGVVEVDEMYLAGPDPVKRPRSPRNHIQYAMPVGVAVELRDPKGFGRIRLSRLAAANETALSRFVQEVVQPGATVHTDGSHVYRELINLGYGHNRTVHLGSPDPPHKTMPAVHHVAALLKRWLMGTHQGAVGAEHLDRYLEEFAFRFNRRTSRSRGLIFYRLLEQAVVTPPETYAAIVASSAKPQDIVVGGAN
jgi:transposase-like protein